MRPRARPIIQIRLRGIKEVQIQRRIATTVLGLISRTQECAVVGRGTGVIHSSSVDGIAAPALSAVLDAGVIVLVVLSETLLNGHGGAIVVDLLAEGAAGGGFVDTGVVGEVGVAGGDYGGADVCWHGAAGVGGGGRGRG